MEHLMQSEAWASLDFTSVKKVMQSRIEYVIGLVC